MEDSGRKITVLIEAVNESEHLAECLDSARFLTDRIIVIDQGSTDGSVSIALKAGAQVIQHSPVTVVEEVRKFGIEAVKTEWVFILDADERMTAELAREILNVTDGAAPETHYKVPRKNMFGGTAWLRHGGWWPDEQLRLIRVDAFGDWPERIHSTPVIAGAVGYLTEPIVHYFHGDIAKMVEKTGTFEHVESELLYNAGRRAGSVTFMRKFLGELYRRMFRHAGFLDGNAGIIESLYQAYSKTVTYLMLYEKQKSRTV